MEKYYDIHVICILYFEYFTQKTANSTTVCPGSSDPPEKKY